MMIYDNNNNNRHTYIISIIYDDDDGNQGMHVVIVSHMYCSAGRRHSRVATICFAQSIYLFFLVQLW